MIDFCLGLIRVSDSGDTNKRAKILSENRIQLQSGLYLLFLKEHLKYLEVTGKAAFLI